MNRKILIVDEECDNCTQLIQWLNPLGFAIELASNGEEAVRKAGNSRPDLIIIDSRMPVMDSSRARRILKAAPETKNIPIVRVLCLQNNASDEAADGFYRDASLCRPAARQRESHSLWLDFDNSKKSARRSS